MDLNSSTTACQGTADEYQLNKSGEIFQLAKFTDNMVKIKHNKNVCGEFKTKTFQIQNKKNVKTAPPEVLCAVGVNQEVNQEVNQKLIT